VSKQPVGPFESAGLVVPETLDGDMLASCGSSLAELAVPVHDRRRAVDGSERASGGADLPRQRRDRLVEQMERQGLVVPGQAAGEGGGVIAPPTQAGVEVLCEAYPYHLASGQTNVMDHLDGLDSISFAEGVGSFAKPESNRTDVASPVAHRYRLVRDQSLTSSHRSLVTLADVEADTIDCLGCLGEGL
jgi:hypothetical protein